MLHHLSQRLDVRWRRPTTSTDNVEPAVVDKAFELGCQRCGSFVIVPLFVWEPGIGMAAHRDGGQSCEGAQVVGHELRTSGTVEANRQRLEMDHRSIQGLNTLPS